MEGYLNLRQSGLTNDPVARDGARWVFQWVERFLGQVVPWVEAAAQAHAEAAKGSNGARPPGGWPDGGSDYQEGDSDSRMGNFE